MSKSELGVAMVHEVCPICGRPMNHGIIMNSTLTIKAAEQIKKYNNKCIGISRDACEDCMQYKDKAVFCIAIDPYKGDYKNPYRTGKIVGISKEAPFLKEHPEFVLTTDNGVSFCFIEEAAGKEMGIFE